MSTGACWWIECWCVHHAGAYYPVVYGYYYYASYIGVAVATLIRCDSDGCGCRQ